MVNCDVPPNAVDVQSYVVESSFGVNLLLNQSLNVVLSFSKGGQTAHKAVAGKEPPFNVVWIDVLA